MSHNVRCDSVTGSPPLESLEGAMTETATTTLDLNNTQGLLIVINKTLIVSDTVNGVSAGDKIDYEIDVTNSGTTTLSRISITSAIPDDQLERCDLLAWCPVILYSSSVELTTLL